MEHFRIRYYDIGKYFRKNPNITRRVALLFSFFFLSFFSFVPFLLRTSEVRRMRQMIGTVRLVKILQLAPRRARRSSYLFNEYPGKRRRTCRLSRSYQRKKGKGFPERKYTKFLPFPEIARAS